MVSLVFLDVNGLEVRAAEEDAYLTFLHLAAGEVTEEELGEWLERNTEAR